jgi:hypothetical protein
MPFLLEVEQRDRYQISDEVQSWVAGGGKNMEHPWKTQGKQTWNIWNIFKKGMQLRENYGKIWNRLHQTSVVQRSISQRTDANPRNKNSLLRVC